MLHLAHSPPFHTKLTASLCRATRRAACPVGVHTAVVAPPHLHQRRFLIRTFCASLSRPLYSQHQLQQLRQHPQPLSLFSTYARYRGLLTRCGKVPSVAIKPTTSSSSLSAPSALSESAPAVSVAPSSTRPPSVSGKPAGLASSTFTSVPATPSSPSPPPRPEMPNCEQSLVNIVRSMSYHEKLKEDADREEDTGEEPVLLRGAPIADDMLRKIKEKVAILTETHRVTPSLVVVQVGDRADSSKYIRIKRVTAAEVGINFRLYKIDDTKDTQSLLLRLIQDLNEDDSVHGVVVQHPLPKHVDEHVITNAISVGKDVDGFRYGNYTHPVVTDPNSPFKLFSHSEYFRHLFPNYSPVTSKDNEPPILGHYPCAPLAVVGLLFGYQVDIAGKNVLVIGASENVGTPISRMLAAEGANVVTVDALSSLDHIVDASLYSDIIVSCCGVPRFVKRHWVRKGAAVVDVGINFIPYTYSDPVDSAPTDSTDDVVAEERAAMAALSAGASPSTHVPMNATAIVDGTAKKNEGDTKAYLERSPEFQKLVDGDKVERTLGVKMVGDVDFDQVKKRAGFITPVPGGVGPLTVAFLLSNVLISAYDSARISRTFKAMSSATRAATIPSSSSDRSTA